MSTFQYHRPTTLEEAFRHLREQPEARLVAGGTDVLPHARATHARPPALISLRRVRELDGIDAADPARTRIGGLTRVADLTGHAELGRRLPALAAAAGRLGSVQIRNVATIGGNLCNASPCADLAPPLLVYQARVQIRGPEGARELPLEEFFVGNGQTRLRPGEVLAAVVVDTPAAGTAARFDKLVRVRMDVALVSLAMALRCEQGRIVEVRAAMGSVAPRPLRLHRVEQFLDGRPVTAAAAHQAGQIARDEITPIDDQRASAGYRRQVAAVLVERAVRDLGGGS